MAGLAFKVEAPKVNARAGVRIYTAQGRQTFVPVHLVRREDGYVAFPAPGDSGSITTLAYSEGFVEIPASKAFVEEGEQVEVRLFTEKLRLPDLVFVGGKCAGVYLIAEILRAKHSDLNFKIIGLGSMGGLAALRRGEADIAGICLLDEKTGKYNVPFLEFYGLKGDVSLFRGYLRRWGLLVAKGNPKEIKSLEDILREDLKFIVPDRSLEARALLDFHLRRLTEEHKIDFGKLAGKFETASKLAIAMAVAEGKADVGFGDEILAERFNLDFIPVAEEEYDFAVRNDRLGRMPVQAFLSILSSGEFREALTVRVRGLKPQPNIGEKIA